MEPDIYTSFDPATCTWQYIVADPKSCEAVIIDSVLDFDPSKNLISTGAADKILDIVRSKNLKVTKILETHAHADHLTAATYLQQALVYQGEERPERCIGKRIKEVQTTFAKKYGVEPSELENVFDRLFDDDEIFPLGSLTGKVLYLPGHTPDHIGYMIGENVFTGDSIFNPDVGSARADFPGGSATDLFRSAQILLSLPPHYRLYTGHDYPPATRGRQEYATVAEHKERNKHVKSGTTEEEFVKWRSERDATLGEPRLLHQALQFNIRAGCLPRAYPEGDVFVRVPVKMTETAAKVMAV